MLLPIDPTRHWHRSLCFVFAGIALLVESSSGC